jgi:UDP-N-acetylmuramoyl-L-alanyl-D-glutamate--2,6-diaminopimelate ligase
MIGYLAPNYPLVAAFRTAAAAPRRTARRAGPDPLAGAPRLSSLLDEPELVAHRGDLDRPFSGISFDSRQVLPGHVFFALPGRRTDGTLFIEQAVARGAVAVVSERLPAAMSSRVTYVQVADARRTLARCARRHFGFPDRSLEVVGVAGTSGKTIAATFLRTLLAGPGERVGLIGSVRYELGPRTVPAYLTTPESLDLHGLLAQIRDAGARQAVVELSRPGLAAGRAHGLQLAVAVCTNAASSEDAASFLALFEGRHAPAPKAAVVNVDDPAGRRLASILAGRTRVVGFGRSAAAEVRAEAVVAGPDGTDFTLVWPGGSRALRCPLPGAHSVSDLLAACAAARALGRDLDVVAPRLRHSAGVPGRLEPVEAGQPFRVLVDYAHTPHALAATLAELRPLSAGRLLVVVGAGGTGDRRVRPALAAAAAAGADVVWFTADNSRSEDVGRILDDLRAGVPASAAVAVEPDRRAAIAAALAAARPGDTVLIAGKGHETFQAKRGTMVPFDDRQVARTLLAVPDPLPA